MTLEEKDRESLVKYRINQAEETKLDVQLLIDNDRLRSAVNRIYYGMFYALLALAAHFQFETSKHSQLIGWFNKNFIHTKQIDPRFGKIINKAFNRRTKGDYDTYIEFERKIVVEMFQEMEQFITEMERFLDSQK
ncbi:MAG: HEPN domain-containing protein [Prolixibacteraceae bacterium]|jgi:uncharacterized protein (UPF0332 family)|nr:HEPN domain-containing protein [Prolixibacteraceae bacterium]